MSRFKKVPCHWHKETSSCMDFSTLEQLAIHVEKERDLQERIGALLYQSGFYSSKSFSHTTVHSKAALTTM